MQISLKSVSYTYNYKTPYAREVLKDINLKIDEGSYTVIVGKTGSGKSTLIEHINGLLLPTKGEVAVDNVLITNPQSKKERRELAKKHSYLTPILPLSTAHNIKVKNRNKLFSVYTLLLL